ncbi:hypothetical protein ACK6WS_24925, partial [Escherichia coli]
MGSCAAPSAKGDDKFITTDYLQQCQLQCVPIHLSVRTHPPFILRRQKTTPILMKLLIKKLAQCLQNKLK